MILSMPYVVINFKEADKFIKFMVGDEADRIMSLGSCSSTGRPGGRKENRNRNRNKHNDNNKKKSPRKKIKTEDTTEVVDVTNAAEAVDETKDTTEAVDERNEATEAVESNAADAFLL
jgi:hypothetical protein